MISFIFENGKEHCRPLFNVVVDRILKVIFNPNQ